MRKTTLMLGFSMLVGSQAFLALPDAHAATIASWQSAASTTVSALSASQTTASVGQAKRSEEEQGWAMRVVSGPDGTQRLERVPGTTAPIGWQAEGSQLLNATDCSFTPGLIIQDDGSVDAGWGFVAATDSRFVDRFTPTAYPANLGIVCFAMGGNPGAPTSLSGEIIVVDDDGAGGAPGTQLAAQAFSVTGVPVLAAGQPIWFSADLTALNVSVTSGSVYIGVRWTQTDPGLFIAGDTSANGRPVGFAGGYRSGDGGTTWTTNQTGTGSFLQYRAMFIRAAFDNGAPALTFPKPYCQPFTTAANVETISLVQFAGIDNATAAGTGASFPTLEDFLSNTDGVVDPGQTYAMTVKGHTGGNFNTQVRAFFDWDRNGQFNSIDESYYIGQISNSNGADAVQAQGDVLVPAGVAAGPVRMRVHKRFGDAVTAADNPCTIGGFGQTEDYVVTVTGSGGSPEIDVTPASLSATLDIGDSEVQTLTIANNGDAPLNWDIDEENTGGTCTALSDIPWLSLSATSGDTDPGDSSNVDVTFNATALTAGSYAGNLCVNSDDLANPLVIVPVSLTVEEPSAPQPAFFNSALTTASPTYDSPGGSPAGSAVQYYCAQQFTVDASGNYVIESASPNTTGTPSDALDTYLNLYSGAFDPLTPSAGLVTGNDDFTGALTVLPGPYAGTVAASTTGFQGAQPGSRIASAALTAGTTYILVNTSFRSTDYAATGTQGRPIGAFYTGIGGPGSVTLVGATCVTTGPTDPEIAVDPAVLDFTVEAGDSDSDGLDITNIGGGTLEWDIVTANADASGALRLATSYRASATDSVPAPSSGSAAGQDRASGASPAGAPAPRAVPAGVLGGPVAGDWSEGFDDILTLPGAGWGQQNNSGPSPGSISWFQGGAGTNFPAHSGAVTSYIAANFNNVGGAGTISNWLLTPEIVLENGTELTFWSRGSNHDGQFPDRLEVRLSTAGASTNVGTAPTDVGDFTQVLLTINETLAPDGYPQVWTEYTVTVSGLGTPTSGRIAFRYFVPNSGPSGSNGDFIGIDTLSVTQPTTGPTGCDNPETIPWLSVSPDNGDTGAGQTDTATVTVNATGLTPGLYEALLCVTSNDTVTPLVEVPVGLTVTAPGGSVLISVDPTALSSSQNPNTVQTQTLTITNDGTNPGNFTIVETTASGPDKPRGGPVELYNNGPMITNPGAGPGGSDVSLTQPPGTLIGAGAQQTVPNRVAEDFTVTGSGWDIDTITFYSYQTGSTTTPTFTGVTVRIWDGVPGAGGSNVVWGDDTTNVFGSATWTGIYRAGSTTPTDTTRPVMAVVANTPVSLPPGTYWMDYALSGTLASGPWVNPVAIPGSHPVGNALQAQGAGGAFNPLLDAGAGTQVTLPFSIVGTAGGGGGGCTSPSDIPWLDVSPTTGSVAAGGGTFDVTVEYDSAGMTPGTYNAKLCVESDDTAGNDLIEVPVSLTVLGSVDSSDLALSLFSVPGTVDAGGSVSIVATVANFGPSNASDVEVELELPAEFTFVSGSLIEGSGNWSCSAAGSTVTCELTAGTLPTGSFAAVLQVNVDVDPDADDGTVITNGTVSSASTDPNAANNDASATTTIIGGPSDLIFADGFELAGDPDVVVFDGINFTVPVTTVGGSVRWDTGETCTCDTAPFNFNIWTTGGNAAFFWPTAPAGTNGGVATGSVYDVLSSGAVIGPSSTYITDLAAAAAANWRQPGNVDGYLGFRFQNPATSQINYGYVRITTTGTTGHPATIVSWAYNSAGNPITIP